MNCSAESCSREVAARGLCIMHYKRVWRKTGPIWQPTTRSGISDSHDPLEVRFWRRVEKSDGCWEWRCGRHQSGYGYLNHQKKQHLAHRLSYELSFGHIPQELLICHRCDNRGCVRPEHLFAGTQSDNIQDCHRKGRSRWHRKEMNSCR